MGLTMAFDKTVYPLVFFFLWMMSVPPSAEAQRITTLHQSVEQALNYSPQLQALTHAHEAVEYDLKQARGGYLPTVDLSLGYGSEQHSDRATRRFGAKPSDRDWDSRSDAVLTLTQKVYDGGETGSQISIRKAQLSTAEYQLQTAAQAIALDAVTAHLNVFLQRELVSLSEQNVKIHHEIYQSLAESERAGAGNIADVTQAQARLARAESTLYLTQADLSQAIAYYTRVIGVPPGELAYTEVPEMLPQTLEQALQRTEQGNPELLALDAELVEADSRLKVARSRYDPKIDFELSSRYNDQLEGDPSWQNTNAAMLYLRWNLFHGGQDKAGVSAALSRKHQIHSRRTAKLLELTETTSKAWADYHSLQRQKAAFREAVDYSRKTSDAYLKQFAVSRRSLLDVLSAENEYFQSSVQLLTANMNEILTAYRILALMGALQVPRSSGVCEYPEDFNRVRKVMLLPASIQSREFPIPVSTSVQAPHPVQKVVPAQDPNISRPPHESKNNGTGCEAKLRVLYAVEIGPCINKLELNEATEALNQYGFGVRQILGSGPVKIVRLLEGVYPPEKARRRLAVLKETVDSAFLLPEGGQFRLYAGSFHESDRAHHFAELLGQKQIKVAEVAVEVEMQGRMLVVQQVDRQTAETIAERISRLGLIAQVITPDPNLME